MDEAPVEWTWMLNYHHKLQILNINDQLVEH